MTARKHSFVNLPSLEEEEGTPPRPQFARLDEEDPNSSDTDANLDELAHWFEEDSQAKARFHPLVQTLAWTVVITVMVGVLAWAERWHGTQLWAAAGVLALFLVQLAYTCTGRGEHPPWFNAVTAFCLVATSGLLQVASTHPDDPSASADMVTSAPFVLVVVMLMVGSVYFAIPVWYQCIVIAFQGTIYAVFIVILFPSLPGQATECMVCVVCLAGALMFVAVMQSRPVPHISNPLFRDIHKRASERQVAFQKRFPEEARKGSVAFLSPVERAVLKLKRLHDMPGATPQHRRAIQSVMSSLYTPDTRPVAALGMDMETEAWMKQEKLIPATPREVARSDSAHARPVRANSANSPPRLLQRGESAMGLTRRGRDKPQRSSTPSRVGSMPIIQDLESDEDEAEVARQQQLERDRERKEKERKAAMSQSTERLARRDVSVATFGMMSVGQAIRPEGGKYPEQLLSADRLAKVQALLDRVDEWNFPIFELDELTQGHALYYMSLAIFQRRGFIERFNIPPRRLRNFLLVIESNYQPNPYHNATHAADVLQTNHFFLLQALNEDSYAEYTLGACIAAIVHDYEHNGVNNDFLIKSQHARANVYNDVSCQENHHLAASFVCMREQANNFLSQLPVDKQRFIRKVIIECVLATDMARHNDILSAFRLKLTSGAMEKEQEDNILMILKIALKCADVSHTSKEEALHDVWTQRITEEFCRQGDLEREFGLPVSPIMDRSTLNLPKSQLGFFKFVVEPLFEAFNSWLQMKDAPFMHFIQHHHKRYEQMLKDMEKDAQ